jgi:Flp pilus assembly protein TadD
MRPPLWAANLLGALVVAAAFAVGVAQSVRHGSALPHLSLPVDGVDDHVSALLAKDDHDGAIRDLRMQTRLLRADHRPHQRLGLLLAEQGRLDEAREEFQAVLRLRPNDPDAHNNLGATFLSEGDLPQAAWYFERTLSIKPDYPEAANNLGVILAQQGRLDEAADYFESAVRIRPDYAEARSNLDRARRAQRQAAPAAP